MKILVIGSGGREHALAWKLKQSPRVGRLYVAPGNGGTEAIATNVPIKVTDVAGLLRFAEQEGIDFTVAPQDDALAAGVVDAFQASKVRKLRIFGPTKLAAEIESSKAFAKEAMRDADILTAPFQIFEKYERALAYVRGHSLPVVVKASGLALGKGAYVCKTLLEAETALENMMVKLIHGDAGKVVVIEEFLAGPEVSIHAFCDGKNFSLFPSAQDHKPAFDNDQGPNTGGMGTIAPVPWFSQELMRTAGEDIVGGMLRELSFLGRPFVGCLYPGLKVTPSGLAVLEYNARPGDPETQSYMRLLKTDLLDIMEACVDGKLAECKVEWHPGFAVCIVLASGGYPGSYAKGKPITGIEDAEGNPLIKVFHAGTAVLDGQLVTAGGRVLGVTATGATLWVALQTAYNAVKRISFEGMQHRTDIGEKSLGLAVSSQVLVG